MLLITGRTASDSQRVSTQNPTVGANAAAMGDVGGQITRDAVDNLMQPYIDDTFYRLTGLNLRLTVGSDGFQGRVRKRISRRLNLQADYLQGFYGNSRWSARGDVWLADYVTLGGRLEQIRTSAAAGRARDAAGQRRAGVPSRLRDYARNKKVNRDDATGYRGRHPSPVRLSPSHPAGAFALEPGCRASGSSRIGGVARRRDGGRRPRTFELRPPESPAPEAPSSSDESPTPAPAARVPIAGYELAGQRIDPDDQLMALLQSVAPIGEPFIESGPSDRIGKPLGTIPRLAEALDAIGYRATVTKRAAPAAASRWSSSSSPTTASATCSSRGNWPIRQDEIQRRITIRPGRPLPPGGRRTRRRAGAGARAASSTSCAARATSRRPSGWTAKPGDQEPAAPSTSTSTIDKGPSYPLGPITFTGNRALRTEEIDPIFRHAAWYLRVAAPGPVHAEAAAPRHRGAGEALSRARLLRRPRDHRFLRCRRASTASRRTSASRSTSTSARGSPSRSRATAASRRRRCATS